MLCVMVFSCLPLGAAPATLLFAAMLLVGVLMILLLPFRVVLGALLPLLPMLMLEVLLLPIPVLLAAAVQLRSTLQRVQGYPINWLIAHAGV